MAMKVILISLNCFLELYEKYIVLKMLDTVVNLQALTGESSADYHHLAKEGIIQVPECNIFFYPGLQGNWNSHLISTAWTGHTEN